MEPNKINLPDFLLADWYKNDLVLIDNDLTPVITETKESVPTPRKITVAAASAQVNAPVEKHAAFTFLGSNKKHIGIIVDDAGSIHLQDDLLEILSAILSACKLNLADVAIVNVNKQQVNDAILRKELSPHVVILFGVQTTTVDLPFSIPLYKPQPFNNCTYLQSVSLEKMKGSSTEAKIEKSKLWVSLKNLFGI